MLPYSYCKSVKYCITWAMNPRSQFSQEHFCEISFLQSQEVLPGYWYPDKVFTFKMCNFYLIGDYRPDEYATLLPYTFS